MKNEDTHDAVDVNGAIEETHYKTFHLIGGHLLGPESFVGPEAMATAPEFS